MIKVNYLYNSGFVVETENNLLIFDYFLDSVESGVKRICNGAVGVEDLSTDKNIVVFSSHSHHDHFNPVILQWQSVRSDIKYVLSSDITIDKKGINIYMMNPYEKIQLDSVTVKSFGSTDLGVSFLVNVDGYNIFHAGDLNWWYWWDDTTEEIEKAENWFKEEVSRIEGEDIDIAFFPVDPRLEHNYCIGAKYFIEKLKPKVLVPMHFETNYLTTKHFKEENSGFYTQILQVTHRGQQLEVFQNHTP